MLQEVNISKGRGYFLHGVFCGIYSMLLLLGNFGVDEIKKHLLGLTQSNIGTLALISIFALRVWAEMRAAVSIFYFVRP